ncbi:MAG: hypothetical protein PHX83_10375 [Acidobacteriia bacterium]|nr:hypothetical protein [Terriglobia bacterium]
MKLSRPSLWILTLGILLVVSGSLRLRAQVSPAEIRNGHLRGIERTYLKQLIAAQRAIEKLKFPYGFSLDRYVGLEPGQQLGADTRGLEFVNFHDHVVLKVTGNYNAAFNADLLTPNQRADQAFNQVAVPILQTLPKFFSSDDQFERVGLEIAFHTRRKSKNYDYEGKEILVVVMDKPDAFAYAAATNAGDQQALLNRSEIFLNGKAFGLALGKGEPLDAADMETAENDPPVSPALLHPSSNTFSASKTFRGDDQASTPATAPAAALAGSAKESAGRIPEPSSLATQADADQLQTQYQAQLEALGKEGAAKMHFVEYAPPSFVIFKNQIYLQVTLRNPAPFDGDATSIYRRSAQTFDLFLAPLLKPILDRISTQMNIAGLDVSVLNTLHRQAQNSSEAVEFVSPNQALRQFVNADITNQDLINQSIVMVNGVRINLNLQQVE